MNDDIPALIAYALAVIVMIPAAWLMFAIARHYDWDPIGGMILALGILTLASAARIFYVMLRKS